MAENYAVRFENGRVTFHYSNSNPAPAPVDIITVVGKTVFVFTADIQNSDAQVAFTIKIDPQPPQIIINSATPQRIQLTDACSARGDIHLDLTMTRAGDVIHSGRPIIRNRPIAPVSRLKQVAIAVALIAAAALIYYTGNRLGWW